ncbi:histidine triad nucleotide-binding protein [Terriglobus tenax]|uniref:histidine triad nucleotide-binding protein n=1 Tax=Terriglobus tenax TaxID=1111115 RepID=UPI0021E09813|nr:histidine triad nucleotide-binding protein [Terriglobus tenax]
MASDCIFCKIAAGEIPAKKAYEDEHLFAFHDIDPKAPTHVLVIPRQHIASLAHASDKDAATLSQLLNAVPAIAAQLGLTNGFRTVINTGADGGQTVSHLHLHILGGRAMHWPPG